MPPSYLILIGGITTMARLKSIFGMFGHSPIQPLQQHMEKTQACVQQLSPFFIAVIAGDWISAEQHQQVISSLETEADQLKKDLRLHLPNSLFLPVPRTDFSNSCIHKIASLIKLKILLD